MISDRAAIACLAVDWSGLILVGLAWKIGAAKNAPENAREASFSGAAPCSGGPAFLNLPTLADCQIASEARANV